MRRNRTRMIERLADVAAVLHCPAAESFCSHVLNRKTIHGVYLVAFPEGIRIGPRWADQEYDETELRYPFQAGALWDAAADWDEQAEQRWHATHGCSHCGGSSVNPNCMHCHGVGV